MSEAQKVLIQVDNVSAEYEEQRVLSNINLTIYERDFLGIIGPNGGGKTTLIKIILGLKKPAEGSLHFFRDGQPVSTIKMGYLPQYNSIDKKFPISVYEVILSGLSEQKRMFHHFSAEQHQRVKAMVAHMGLEGMEQKPIGALSGGELQRTLLGRALVSEPDAVVLDEPNTYIDEQFQERMYKLLEEENKQRAIILVSHDIGSVLQNVKTIACVNNTLHYHPDIGIDEEWLEKQFGCPIDLIGHGDMPHRILKTHDHEH
jgi:zinc transport system ATP-binding protein